MDFNDYTTIEFPVFPHDQSIVYVLCFRLADASEEIPFYVGQSGRGLRRIADYITAQFAATTDFRVGVVVKALQDAGATISIKYKASARRRKDETSLILKLRDNHALLNAEHSYDYRTADRKTQRERFKTIARGLLDGTYRPGTDDGS